MRNNDQKTGVFSDRYRWMRIGFVVLILGVSVAVAAGVASGENDAGPNLTSSTTDIDASFRDLIEKIAPIEIPASFIDFTFSSNKVKIHDEIVERFNHPAERLSYRDYQRLFINDGRIRKGIQFYTTNKSLISAVADSFGVDPYLLLSIVGVESNFGSHHAEYSVFNSLYTVYHRLPRKASWAVRQLAEYLAYCYQDQVDPHDIYGSYAGAFGYGQFIPSSFNSYAVDFDGDGVRQPFDWPDVFGSVANYLIRNGYPKMSNDFTTSGKVGRSIWAYNHSENYVRAVLELRQELKKTIEKS